MKRVRLARQRAAAVVASLLWASVLVAIPGEVTNSATPPAELVSVTTTTGNATNPSISGDGAQVGFDLALGSLQVESVRNRAGSQTENVPFAGNPTPVQHDLVVSRDGCQIADFNDVLVNGATGQAIDVANRCASSPARQIYTPTVSQTDGGLDGLAISSHGRFVAFTDNSNHTVVRLDRDSDGNGILDDSAIAVATSISPAAGASLGDETITGKVAIAAQLAGTTQTNIFLWDPTPGAAVPMQLVSATDGTTTAITTVNSTAPSMTPDGRYVTFVVSSITAVFARAFPIIQQVLARDVVNNRTAVISRNAAGKGGNGNSFEPSITADGTQIAFGTTSTDLATPGVGGVNGVTGSGSPPSLDLLVARSQSGFFATLAFDPVSLKANGDPIDPTIPVSFGTKAMEQPEISSNGRWVAFASTFNAELTNGGSSAVQSSNHFEQVYVIGRPTSVAVTPLDFGALNVGTASGPKLATVTNTGISSFLPATMTAGGDFAVVAGGSCAVNAWLSPGQSCTIAVRFVPTAGGGRSSTLTVAETGFAAVTATAPLTGSGVASTTTNPTTSTTTKTTVPATTTTTIPKVATLVINPAPASFGLSVIGVAAPPIDFTVSSTGTATAPITDLNITGADSPDFVITATTCVGAKLKPGQSCSVTVTFTPSGPGARVSRLGAGSAAAVATSDLDGSAIYEPTLRLLPNVVAVGEVTIASGMGFPPNDTIQLQWNGDPAIFTGTSDVSGAVAIQIPIRSDELPGPRTLTVIDQPGQFAGVTAPALVVETSVQPPTSPNPAFPFPSIFVRA